VLTSCESQSHVIVDHCPAIRQYVVQATKSYNHMMGRRNENAGLITGILQSLCQVHCCYKETCCCSFYYVLSVVGWPAGDGGAADGDAKQQGHVEHKGRNIRRNTEAYF
jgi:hypothetical protein